MEINTISRQKMSTALASARKRRAPPQPIGSAPAGTGAPNGPSPQQNTAGLTLPQVITIVDRRLITLETFMKEYKDNMQSGVIDTTKSVTFSDANADQMATLAEVPSNLNEVLEEYNSRFDILAEEISNIKNIVLNLQSYTMDVNKVLMQDRIRILSEDPSSLSQTLTLDESLEEALSFANP